jgi:CRISPR-associated endonuclease/helicase Cas3
LKERLNASKLARLIPPTKAKTKREAAAGADDDDTDSGDKDLIHRAAAIVKDIRRAFEHFKRAENGASAPAIGVVVNRVARARTVFEHLKEEFKEQIQNATVGEPILMIGPSRSLDRDALVKILEPIRTRTWNDGERRTLDKPLIFVATQCIEVGVDIDFDALITEAAPLDALRQRFGRLNRAGRSIAPYAAVIAGNLDVSARYQDPVYGQAIKPAWDYLAGLPDGKEDGFSIIDFGLSAFNARTEKTPVPAEALSPKDDAPILLPAHLDLFSQTSPIPAADPDIALYLHGRDRQPDSITVVWRADVDSKKPPAYPMDRNERTRRLLMLVPPRASEAIELPVWAVRRWLTQADHVIDQLADVAVVGLEDESSRVGDETRKVFRWKGDDERSRWARPSDLRPGDTIVVPASYGGVDEFGWNPRSNTQVSDIARTAAESFTGRRFTVRVAPGLIGPSLIDEALSDALARAASQRWRDLRDRLLDLDLPEEIRNDLEALDHARRDRAGIVTYTDLYGNDEQGRPRGIVFVAPLGIKADNQEEDGRSNATEDDASGSMPGFALTLEAHCQDVATKAEAFAKGAGLPPTRVADLKLAGHLHDAGKVDPRFQAWLYYGDPLGPDPDRILAKSGRPLPRAARAASGLPERWRHEALSVRVTPADDRFSEASDPELVLWLIGTHHGQGRPLFPHHDPSEKRTEVGPQSLAFDWKGYDWTTLFVRLKARYGIWELARMEAILRLADHRASEEERAATEGFR